MASGLTDGMNEAEDFYRNLAKKREDAWLQILKFKSEIESHHLQGYGVSFNEVNERNLDVIVGKSESDVKKILSLEMDKDGNVKVVSAYLHDAPPRNTLSCSTDISAWLFMTGWALKAAHLE